MPKVLTREVFISKAKAIHGDKYGYDEVVYVNNKTKVKIYCKHCKEFFMQSPREHLVGKGCRNCGIEKSLSYRKGLPSIKNRKIKFGICINDYDGVVVDLEGKLIPSYQVWCSMIKRCYSSNYQAREPSYKGCSVCDEWKKYSLFKRWFDMPQNGYQRGYELDKDILVKGNKVYSPDTCCFVPKRINSLLLKPFKHRSDLPIGVSRYKKRYMASYACGGKKCYIGLYKTVEEAFEVYKGKKESYIKEIAQEYFDKGLITERVYNALLLYKIEITD